MEAVNKPRKDQQGFSRGPVNAGPVILKLRRCIYPMFSDKRNSDFAGCDFRCEHSLCCPAAGKSTLRVAWSRLWECWRVCICARSQFPDSWRHIGAPGRGQPPGDSSGPMAASLTMATVIIAQAFFADGGHVALGAISSNIGTLTLFQRICIYRILGGGKSGGKRLLITGFLAGWAC